MRILLVEDEEKVSRFIVRGLKAEGHAVDAVVEGKAGQDYLARIFHPIFKARARAAFFDFFARPDVVGGVFGPSRRLWRCFPQPPLFFSVPGTALGRGYALLRRWQTWRKRFWCG